jgi:predicted ester cyclase
MIQHIVSVWRTAFPDLHFAIDTVLAEGDCVVSEVTLSGTHRGLFPMIPPLEGPPLSPNGKKFSVKHLHRFRLRDGKIVEHFAVRDDLGMFQQLGHLTPFGQ